MMKNYILIGVLSGMILGATSASAQYRRYHYDDRYYPRHYSDRYYDDERKADDKKTVASEKESGDCDRDFHCYDAWRKDLKREKKEFKARERWYEDRPESADRKLRKADKKAWKSGAKEYDHKYGWDGHDREHRYDYYRRW
jgi:hypothetical protein